MAVFVWLKLLHVLAAFAFVAGLVGRGFALAYARRCERFAALQAALAIAERADQFLVIPGSFVVLLSGLATAWSEGLPLFARGYYWLSISLGVVLLNFAFVPAVFLPRRKRTRAALARAEPRAEITPDLHEALRDPVLLLTRRVESILLLLVLVLMVLKPL